MLLLLSLGVILTFFQEINRYILDECLIVNTDTLKIYHILNNSKQNNDELNFNVNRKYAILNNKQLMLIQDYVFNKVLININELVE